MGDADEALSKTVSQDESDKLSTEGDSDSEPSSSLTDKSKKVDALENDESADDSKTGKTVGASGNKQNKKYNRPKKGKKNKNEGTKNAGSEKSGQDKKKDESKKSQPAKKMGKGQALYTDMH